MVRHMLSVPKALSSISSAAKQNNKIKQKMFSQPQSWYSLSTFSMPGPAASHLSSRLPLSILAWTLPQQEDLLTSLSGPLQILPLCS